MATVHRRMETVVPLRVVGGFGSKGIQDRPWGPEVAAYIFPFTGLLGYPEFPGKGGSRFLLVSRHLAFIQQEAV